MLEVLSPAGSSDALIAAVQNGADAVYLGYGAFNARMNAKNFTEEQLRQSVSYCHIRGVKVYLTLNTLVLDRELKEASQVVMIAARAGVDAILVQDFGVCQMIRQVAPDMPIHASTQMAIHNLDGAIKAAEMGISRVVLARELSRKEIAAICKDSPVEVEVFVHGALCMCYSGQCYMSAMIGRRSGNRGQCAQPCRMMYGYDRQENRYPLSLKDNCLVGYLRELEQMGVACIKIEGRMKRAEYVAIATKIYKDAAMGRAVTPQQLKDLYKVFSRQGFTDGYYTGRKGQEMFGVHQEEAEDRSLMARARGTYENAEVPRVPVWFRIQILAGQPAVLYAWDEKGHTVSVQGDKPEAARKTALTAEALIQRLSKTGGTPFYVKDIQVELTLGVILSAASLNAMRREALSMISALRGQVAEPRLLPFIQPEAQRGTRQRPGITIQIQSYEQITERLVAMNPTILYVPLHLLQAGDTFVQAMCQSMHVAAVLPRVIQDHEWDRIGRQLAEARALGVREVLVGNLGMIDSLRRRGFTVRGDFGLNVFNTGSVNYLAQQGLASVTASFELTLPQIRDLGKPIPMELIVYGRLPLMITENCIIHNRSGACICGSTKTTLVDRTGSHFPVVRDADTCRSMILNSKKLYLGDKISALSTIGLSALRLNFTTESAQQVDAILQDFTKGAGFDPGTCTRGLYMRGVE